MTTALFTTAVGLMGVMIGVALQYLTARSLEHRKHIQELRSKAYVDFLTAVASVASPNKSTVDSANVVTRLTDAKVRITVYGSAGVIDALAIFCRTDQVLGSAISNTAFIRLVRAMRVDSAAGVIDERDVMTILLGE